MKACDVNFDSITLKTFSKYMEIQSKQQNQILIKIENIVANVVIAHYEQFLLLFQKSSSAESMFVGRFVPFCV